MLFLKLRSCKVLLLVRLTAHENTTAQHQHAHNLGIVLNKQSAMLTEIHQLVIQDIMCSTYANNHSSERKRRKKIYIYVHTHIYTHTCIYVSFLRSHLHCKAFLQGQLVLWLFLVVFQCNAVNLFCMHTLCMAIVLISHHKSS